MNLYQTAYDLMNTYIYGGTVVAETYQDLVCIVVATSACLFTMSLPFIIVWRFIKMWF